MSEDFVIDNQGDESLLKTKSAPKISKYKGASSVSHAFQSENAKTTPMPKFPDINANKFEFADTSSVLEFGSSPASLLKSGKKKEKNVYMSFTEASSKFG